jgi:CRP-like cAMP-binding protein
MLPGAARQIVSVFLPGDVMCTNFVPPEAEAALVVAGAGEIWRLRTSALHALVGQPAIGGYLERTVASRTARHAIHTVMLGRFDCEQKLATLFVELALRTGVWSPGGAVAFDLRFSRQDIAD